MTPLVDGAVPENVAAALQADLRTAHPQATLRWTGEAALNYDLWRSSADDTHRAERRTLPVTFALLLFAFGSVVAALLTVASGALAVGLALGLVAVAARYWPLSILTDNVVSMIGLALGIDYALLTVSRFREARGTGAPPAEAALAAPLLKEKNVPAILLQVLTLPSRRDLPHQASYTAAAELAKAGVSEDMVRLSVGIEHVEDLLADLEQALASA